MKKLLYLLAFIAGPVIATEAPKRPTNVLFIITDQQRCDAVSCAGNTVLKTPHLDKLAAFVTPPKTLSFCPSKTSACKPTFRPSISSSLMGIDHWQHACAANFIQ